MGLILYLANKFNVKEPIKINTYVALIINILRTLMSCIRTQSFSYIK